MRFTASVNKSEKQYLGRKLIPPIFLKHGEYFWKIFFE